MSIPSRIKQLANKVRNEIYGKDVRESIAQSMEVSGETAEEAKNRSIEQTERVNTLIKENPQPSEVVDARLGHATLRDKLNSTDQQLVDIDNQLIGPKLRNGEVFIPGFAFTFSIMQINKRQYNHSASSRFIADLKGTEEIFISKKGTSDSGKNADRPITLRRFNQNYDEGIYNGNIILTFLDDFYFDTGGALGLTGVDADILVRSKSRSGFTWVGRIKRPKVNNETSEWVSSDDIYKTTQSTNHSVIDVINFDKKDKLGMPRPYGKVDNLADCQNKKGTFYQDGNDIYCNPYLGDNINLSVLLVNAKQIDTSHFLGSNLIFENIGFLAESHKFHFPSVNNNVFFFSCKFYRGLNDGLSINGSYKVYLFDCVSAYSSKDGFNYHTNNVDSLAMEINCMSYGHGMYKMQGGNTTKHSNNASTAHDGMSVVRIGNKYWQCEGPTVADADDCLSVNIGCEVDDMLPTNGVKAGYYFYDGDSAVHNPKYVVDCYANGKEIEYGVIGTENTYVMNFEGNRKFNSDVKKIDWEELQ